MHTAGAVTSAEASPRSRPGGPVAKVRKNDKTLQKILRSNLSPSSNHVGSDDIDGALTGNNYMTAGPVQVGKLVMTHGSGMNLQVNSQGRIVSANSTRGNSKTKRRTPAASGQRLSEAQFAPAALMGSFKSS